MNKKNEATSTYDAISQATENGRLNEAHRMVEASLKNTPDDATLHYLRGNLYMKSEDWGSAMSSFKRAIEIDKESPAAESLRMLTEIMDFFNKDMYNQ